MTNRSFITAASTLALLLAITLSQLYTRAA
jgi:hypothetical protein